MQFWSNFESLCRDRGQSPTAVCKAAGLSNAVPTYWKNGVIPKVDALLAVCDVLGCSADYLLGRSDRVTSEPVLAKTDLPDLSAYEKRMLDAFRDLCIEDKMYFLGRLEEAARQEYKKEV